MAKLKVYRTPIGFHDAYVAAASQKAALEAWGSDKNLFARGDAELVDDPALTEAPLAHPGEVVKRLRGTAEQQLAAAPSPKQAIRKQAKTAVRPKPPRPSRTAIEAAEQALADLEDQQRDEERALAAEEAKLAERRRTLRAAQIAATRKLEAKRDSAQADYDIALERWRES